MGKKGKIMHTRHGDINLASASGRKRATRLVAEIMRTTEALTRSDIADWRRAWQLAINVDYPSRRRLYDIYRDADIDAHLTGCVEQRKGFVLAKSFRLTGKDGTADDGALHYFHQQWFRQLCSYILDSRMWGHSLVELGDVVTDGNGCPCFAGVRLVPRKYVVPEYHRVLRNLGEDWHTAIDYHESPWNQWLIEAGQPDDLGLLLKAAPQTIAKKNMLAFWDTFGELFGMPMRIGHTTVRDDKELSKMERMMQNMGTEFWALFPEGTEIEVVESTKGDAFNVYDKRVDRANSELSKLIIGQTMTIEDGSSLSQSQTHLEVFQNLVESDASMLADIINNQLLPRMAACGFPVDGLRFEWDDAIDYTPDQQLAYETMIADRYDVDPKYFADKYNMPVGERKHDVAPAQEELAAPSPNSRRPFFD